MYAASLGYRGTMAPWSTRLRAERALKIDADVASGRGACAGGAAACSARNAGTGSETFCCFGEAVTDMAMGKHRGRAGRGPGV